MLGGAGIIGRTVVRDLFRFTSDEILVVERDFGKAKHYAETFASPRVIAVQAEASNVAQLARLFKGVDVVASCVQYTLNLNVMNACLQAGANYVDLGGMFHFTKKEMAFYHKHHKAFQKKGITGILGMGGAPGLSNVLAAYGARELVIVKSIEIVFADVDNTKYEQRFVLPYSFKTLIDEYMMQPAVFHKGKLRFVTPESGKKEYDFGTVFGKQKGFLTLHSELATLPQYFKEKGIQRCEFRVTFPAAFNEVIETLIQLGFASGDKVRVSGKEVEIREVTARLMDQWIPKSGTIINDKELVRVIVHGERANEVVMDAMSESDGIYPAGVLDTGVPCAIACQMLASGVITQQGVFAPESVIEAELFFAELARRGIRVERNGKRVN